MKSNESVSAGPDCYLRLCAACTGSEIMYDGKYIDNHNRLVLFYPQRCPHTAFTGRPYEKFACKTELSRIYSAVRPEGTAGAILSAVADVMCMTQSLLLGLLKVELPPVLTSDSVVSN